MFKKNLTWVRNNISGGIEFMLLSNQFFDDQEVKDAFNVVLNRLEFYQKHLNQVKPKNSKANGEFAKLINVIDTYRGSLYFPFLSAGLGNGPYVGVQMEVLN